MPNGPFCDISGRSLLLSGSLGTSRLGWESNRALLSRLRSSARLWESCRSPPRRSPLRRWSLRRWSSSRLAGLIRELGLEVFIAISRSDQRFLSGVQSSCAIWPCISLGSPRKNLYFISGGPASYSMRLLYSKRRRYPDTTFSPERSLKLSNFSLALSNSVCGRNSDSKVQSSPLEACTKVFCSGRSAVLRNRIRPNLEAA